MDSITSPVDDRWLLGPVQKRVRRSATQYGAAIPRAGLLALLETMLALGVLGAVVIATNVDSIPDVQAILALRVTLRNLLLVAALTAAWPAIFWASGLYDRARTRDAYDEQLRVLGACALGTIAAMIVPALSLEGGVRPIDLLYFWGGTTVGTLSLRAARRSLRSGRLVRRRLRRVLIIGSSNRALRMWQALTRDRNCSYELAGFLDAANSTPASEEIRRHWLGTLDELEQMLMFHAIDDVCIALPIKSRYPDIQETLLVCERVGVRTHYGADLFETQVAWPQYAEAGSPIVTMHVVPDDHRLAIKRLLDIAGATAGLAVLSPLMLIAAAAIKATSPGPVLFAQERYGLNRRRFRMFKFRTMVDGAERLQEALEQTNEADGPVFKMAADPRVTRLGRILRRTSIDELPQLFNVLRGEMSLVGPRPLPLRDVHRFTRAADMRRFSVRPGLTCLWQISGRSNTSFSDWIRLDLAYIDRWSMTLDLWILVKTIPAVLRGTGAQ